MEDTDLLAQLLPVDGNRRRLGLVGVFALREDLVEQIIFDFLGLDELRREIGVAARLFITQRLEADPQRVECRGNGLRRRGEQFPQNQGREMPLPPGECIAVLSLQEAGNCLVERVFFVGRLEWLGDRPPLRVADVLHHLVAEAALAEDRQPLPEGFEIAARTGVLRPERVDIAEEALVDECREAVQFEK